MPHKNQTTEGVAAPTVAKEGTGIGKLPDFNPMKQPKSSLYGNCSTLSHGKANQTCPCCGQKGALAVKFIDDKQLVHCFYGCPQDDVWRAVNGFELSNYVPTPKEAPQRAKRDCAAYIRKLWHDSIKPERTGTESYLQSRGLDGQIPQSIRHLKNLKHSPSQTCWPTMLGKITDVDGNLKAIHRTYLAYEGKTKAPIEPQKMTLGTIGGFAIHFAPPANVMAISEGIETGLSIQQATGISTWAAISAGGMRQLILPPLPLAQEVIICADNDINGCGQDAAKDAALRWCDEGRRVRIAMPSNSNSDFNDLIKGDCHV